MKKAQRKYKTYEVFDYTGKVVWQGTARDAHSAMMKWHESQGYRGPPYTGRYGVHEVKDNPRKRYRKNHWVLPLAVGATAGVIAERKYKVSRKVVKNPDGAHKIRVKLYHRFPGGDWLFFARTDKYTTVADAIQAATAAHGGDFKGESEGRVYGKKGQQVLPRLAGKSSKAHKNPQRSFNPVDYHFRWTTDWYEWDYEAAHKAALKARNEEAKRLADKGYKVRKSTLRNQRITRGGIGSGHPEIDHVVTIYQLDYTDPAEAAEYARRAAIRKQRGFY